MPEKIDFFQGVKDHFESLEVKIIEVPEWGLEGDRAIYVRPFTMNEIARIFKGANDSDLNILVDVLMILCTVNILYVDTLLNTFPVTVALIKCHIVYTSI